MARTPFQVEVLTPEGEVFNDEVEMVSTKTTVGSIGLLANHQPLLAMLDPTELRLYKSESDVVRYAQGEGFLQISGTHALVLVDEVFPVDDLDTGDLREPARARRAGALATPTRTPRRPAQRRATSAATRPSSRSPRARTEKTALEGGLLALGRRRASRSGRRPPPAARARRPAPPRGRPPRAAWSPA